MEVCTFDAEVAVVALVAVFAVFAFVAVVAEVAVEQLPSIVCVKVFCPVMVWFPSSVTRFVLSPEERYEMAPLASVWTVASVNVVDAGRVFIAVDWTEPLAKVTPWLAWRVPLNIACA